MLKKLISWLFGEKVDMELLSDDLNDITEGITQDSLDERDYNQSEAHYDMPSVVDYSEFCPEIKHQGSLNSCGSMAAISGVETLDNMKNGLKTPLSEMYHFFTVRQTGYEGNFPENKGQHGRNAMRVLKNVGAIPENIYPYIQDKFNDGPISLTLAKWVSKYWKISVYKRCYSLAAIKTALAEGKLVWLGVPIRQDYKLYKRGIITYDKRYAEKGGHATLVVGYNDHQKTLKFYNSWGNWGIKGFGLLSYDYLYKVPWFDAWSFNIKGSKKINER